MKLRMCVYQIHVSLFCTLLSVYWCCLAFVPKQIPCVCKHCSFWFWYLTQLNHLITLFICQSIKKTLISYESTFISYNNCMYTNGTTHIDMQEHIFISQLWHRKSFIWPLSFLTSFPSLYIQKQITSRKGWEKSGAELMGFTYKINVRKVNHLLMMVSDVFD